MLRSLARLRRLLAREDGIAVPVALSALMLVSLLAAMTASGALSLSDSSTADRNSKRALAAAEAGLNVAAYRVNYYTDTNPPLALADLAVLNNKCITTIPEYPVGGKCQSATGDLGNNARYTYYVTPNPPPGGCPTDIPDQGPPPPSGTGTRCVTSIGEVNGVKRRAQARLRSTLVPIFSFQGMVGTGGVKVNNNVVLSSAVGSNGTVTVNNGSVGDVYLAPSGSLSKTGPSAQTGTVYPHEPFVLPKLDAEFENSLLIPAPNKNSTLPGTTTRTVTWNPVTRDLFLGPDATITLGSGTYNLCRLKMERNAKLYVASGATVKLFIDSKDRDPACTTAASLGPTLDLASGTQLNNPGEPKNFQLYLYGRNDGTEAITFNNAISFKGSIYAPQTSLKFAADLNVAGAVAAKFLEFASSVNFTWDAALKDIVTALKTYERKGWSECPSKPTTDDDPGSGC